MVEYCLRRPSHQIDGNSVTVTKAEPQFDEAEDTEEDENMKEEADNDQEGGTGAGNDDGDAVVAC